MWLRTFVVSTWFFLGSALVLPVLALRPKHADNGWIYTRFVMPLCARLCGLKVILRKMDRVYTSQPCVYVCNHQSILDLFVHGIYHPRKTLTVGKKSLMWIPIFGWIYYLVGSVFIDRKNHKSAMSSMDSALELMKVGRSIWIFPEGTRSYGRGLLPFKRGAFHLAINAGRPIVPIATSQVEKTVDLRRWRAGTVVIEVLEPIPTVGMTPQDVESLIERTRKAMLDAFPRLNAEAGLLPGVV